jgi:hypothetical protein
MRPFRKLAVFALCLGIGSGVSFSEQKREKPDKKKEPAKKADAKKTAAKEKPEEPKKLAFPVPIGHDSKGLKLPSYGPDGKLKMLFNVGLANRIDEENVAMNETHVETYADDGSPDLDISLPVSNFNLKTRVISTKQAVKITRADFELSGNTMEFDTETRTGRLGGGVKMIIFNLDEEAQGDAKESLPKVELPPNESNQSIKVTKPKPTPAGGAQKP